jgi:hypothetical protein
LRDDEDGSSGQCEDDETKRESVHDCSFSHWVRHVNRLRQAARIAVAVYSGRSNESMRQLQVRCRIQARYRTLYALVGVLIMATVLPG